MKIEELPPTGLVASRRAALKALAAVPLAHLLVPGTSLAGLVAEAGEDLTITTAEGRRIRAACFRPATLPAPAVLLFHEWWGLNDQIRAVAADLAAKQGYLALAVDLYDGKVADNPDEARKLVTGIDESAARETIRAWFRWLGESQDCNGRLATMGWCLGGGWSLAASLVHPVDATVIYYGNVARKAEELRALKGPVLGHFATRDRHIDRKMVEGFAAEMEKAGKPLTVHWYEADHAFANPTGAAYDADDAALAWERSTAFLKANLAG